LRGLLTGAKGPPPVPTENIAHCPSCPGNLAEMLLGQVHVDYCGKCHGIFLDRGELQAAVEAVRAKARDTAAQNIIIAISTAGD
ncbi:MAG TPA: zf-TFIIB domain-containing protein, partial [Polyangia bacterium]|nr:zf-TFIIB domain-containing protein [Polyangia bacterium]